MGLVRWDQRTENKWIVFKGHCIRCGGGKFLIQWHRSMNDYVRRDLREHNQEADHLANLGAEGHRQITVVKGDSTENWMAVRRLWDVSHKTDERSGCGVVVRSLGRNKWITNPKVAAPMMTRALSWQLRLWEPVFSLESWI